MTDIMKVGDTINAKEVMSSLEIAELTGKEHKNILRDIRNLLDEGVQQLNFEQSFIIRTLPNGGTKQEPCFNVTKKGCLILASGYNALLRERIINRWEELELEKQSKQQNEDLKVPTSFAEALRLAAEQAEELERQQKLLEEQAPKVDYYNNIVDRGKSMSFRDTSKLLGYKESAFIFFLLENGYVYRDRKNKLMPIAEYVGKYFEVKEFVRGEHNGVQTLITQQGREHFYRLIENLKKKAFDKLAMRATLK